MKHYAANVFEQLIGKDERFQKYLSKLDRTRSTVQQTELSHFTPPPQKTKARFMNPGPTLRWGQIVSYHLSHCHSKSRAGFTHWTPAKVRESLTAVPMKTMKQWVGENLGISLTSKRATAYREFAKSTG